MDSPRVVRRGRSLALLASVFLGSSVAAAAVAGTIATRPPNWLEPSPATVVLGSPRLYGFNFSEVDVAQVDRARPLREFTAALRVDSLVIGRLEPLMSNEFGGSLRFSDNDFDGRLTAGDRFISLDSRPGTYELVVQWRGTEVARATWRF